jgi:cell division protein FtsI (penicillin-binding protein 3)
VKGRLAFFLALIAAAFAAIGARLYHLQVARHDHYAREAEKQQQRIVELNPPRGTFFDARGRELAVSGPADSVYAVPREIDDPHAVARALARALDLSARELAAKLSGEGWFVWVKRQIEPEEAARVRRLALPGVGLREESKRYYPLRELAAHVVGFVGTDSHGLAGLEQAFDALVSGRVARRVLLRDAGGATAVDPDLGWQEAEPGLDLHLTLDATLQYVAERELARAVEQFDARGGSVVLLDPKSGAVLAMASLPAFDPNRFNDGREARERWRNRVIADAFEPGSTFKMVTAAAALGANLLDPSDVFDCEMGQVTLYGVTIRDHKPFGLLTLREVIARSSNVGAIKVGLRVGDRRLAEQIEALGFGRRTGIELPGESPGILHPRERWVPVTKAYLSFGQGIASTALQLAAAYGAAANGGELVRPFLVRAVGTGDERRVLRRGPEVVGRAMSGETARQVERLLEAVVAEGTGKEAAVAGFQVAGKTGTAQMADGGGRGYSRTDHMAVFAGFAPGRDPVLVGTVVIDRPRADIHGGTVAAPVFGAIARQALMVLGIRPVREEPLPAWPGERPRNEPLLLAAEPGGAPPPVARASG